MNNLYGIYHCFVQRITRLYSKFTETCIRQSRTRWSRSYVKESFVVRCPRPCAKHRYVIKREWYRVYSYIFDSDLFTLSKDSLFWWLQKHVHVYMIGFQPVRYMCSCISAFISEFFRREGNFFYLGPIWLNCFNPPLKKKNPEKNIKCSSFSK